MLGIAITPARVIDRPISGWANFNDITRGTRYLVVDAYVIMYVLRHRTSVRAEQKSGRCTKFSRSTGACTPYEYRVLLNY